jgi:predicted branched-subunit amino acid permease
MHIPIGERGVVVVNCQTSKMEHSTTRAKAPWGLMAGIALTFFALGVTVNVLVLERLGSEVKTVTAAIVVNSATSQLAYLAVRDVGGSVIAAMIAGWIVATRFGLLAAGLAPRLQVGRFHKAMIGLQAFDPNVGIAIQQRESRDVVRVFWLVTAAMHLGWWSGTFAGVFLGNVIGDSQRLGLDAVFPALLLAVIGNLLRQRPGLVAALVGGVLCAVLIPIAPAGLPIIISLTGAVVALGVRPTQTPKSPQPPQNSQTGVSQ